MSPPGQLVAIQAPRDHPGTWWPSWHLVVIPAPGGHPGTQGSSRHLVAITYQFIGSQFLHGFVDLPEVNWK